ncbi:DUF4153 domain-containing protein [Flammeovirga pectinis]|uniref:DUF4153 domain-containing protein n=1 Tax=Flammeovirga pectinis TaxID=2494373 RepID=A0A3Q9FTR5_9BACT|nr:DUF4153 domain-containing protein [Flammeovirga pectinis]AZQ64443.1 DUF4153 domain-containing protein [Flammeovirga pectinis]
MKILSLQDLTDTIYRSIIRFPFTLLCAIFGTFLLFYSIGNNIHTNIWFIRGIHGAQLGIPIFIAATYLSENLNLSIIKSYLLKGISLTVLLLYLMTMPEELTYINFSRWILLTIFTHLLIFIAPNINRGTQLDFWIFSKDIIATFIESLFYSVVIYIGVSIALLSVDSLFNITIDEDVYLKLLTFCGFFLNTLFFICKAPIARNSEEEFSYSPILKNFTQYIMFPLVTIYMVILYAYSVKIIFLQDWPKGWVSMLSIGFSILGIISFLLIYPIKNIKENRWIPIYTKVFFYALFPVILLFIAAIWTRITDYGITENRYYLIVLAIWLVIVALNMLIKGQNNIKIIPISLCILTLISSFGPISAFQIAKNSQTSRLNHIVENEKWIDTNGYWITGIDHSASNEAENTRSIISYLSDYHGFNSLQKYFSQPMNTFIADSLSKWEVKNVLFDKMGLTSLGNSSIVEVSKDEYSIHFYSNSESEDFNAFDIKKYNYLLNVYTNAIDQEYLFTKNDKEFILRINNNDNSIGTIEIDGVIYTITLDLNLIKNSKNGKMLFIESEAFTILLYSLNGNKEKDKLSINHMKAMFLIN